MRRSMPLLQPAVVPALGFAPAPPPRPPEGDLKKTQGTWVLTASRVGAQTCKRSWRVVVSGRRTPAPRDFPQLPPRRVLALLREAAWRRRRGGAFQGGAP